MKMKLDDPIYPSKAWCLHCDSVSIRKPGDNFYKYSYECNCKKKFGSAGITMGDPAYYCEDKGRWFSELCGLETHFSKQNGQRKYKCLVGKGKIRARIFKENENLFLETENISDNDIRKKAV